MPPLGPFLPPATQGRPEIPQALQRVKVRSQRDDDVLGGDQRGAVDRAEIRPDVDENNAGVAFQRSLLDDPPDGRKHTESTRLAVETIRPLARQLVFRGRECEVSHQQPYFIGNVLDVGRRNVTRSFQQRLNRSEDRLAYASDPAIMSQAGLRQQTYSSS